MQAGGREGVWLLVHTVGVHCQCQILLYRTDFKKTPTVALTSEGQVHIVEEHTS